MQESYAIFDSYLSKTFHETFEQLVKFILQEYNTTSSNDLAKESEKDVLDHYLNRFKGQIGEIIEKRIGKKD
jgi:hypothetical protein